MVLSYGHVYGPGIVFQYSGQISATIYKTVGIRWAGGLADLNKVLIIEQADGRIAAVGVEVGK